MKERVIYNTYYENLEEFLNFLGYKLKQEKGIVRELPLKLF